MRPLMERVLSRQEILKTQVTQGQDTMKQWCANVGRAWISSLIQFDGL